MEINYFFILRLIVSSLLVFVLLRLIEFLITYFEKLRKMKYIKGPRVIPFIGNLNYLKNGEGLLNQLSAISVVFKDEPLFHFWLDFLFVELLGWHPTVVFHKCDHLEMLISTSAGSRKSAEYTFFEEWLGTGLLTSYGEKWHKRRRLITPTFHFEILNDFSNIMNEQANVLVEILNKKIENDQPIDLYKQLTLCTLDIICETAMGHSYNVQNDENSEYLRSVTKMGKLIVVRTLTPIYWSDFIFGLSNDGKEYKKCLKTLHNFTRKVIEERNAELESENFSSNKRAALLDMLLKCKRQDSSIKFDDIQEEVDTFMFEGHDTTSAGVAWAFHLIGTHLDVQEKLHNEIDQLFGDSDRFISTEDLKKLKYLECVIKETLRLFPPVPLFTRKVEKDCVVDGNLKLVKDSTATVLIYRIHRDERYFPDPEKFDPDRFLLENSKDRHTFAYIPFSAGKRNCIGQKFALLEEKILITSILRKFNVKSLKSTAELEPTYSIVLKPANGIPFKLTRRN